MGQEALGFGGLRLSNDSQLLFPYKIAFNVLLGLALGKANGPADAKCSRNWTCCHSPLPPGLPERTGPAFRLPTSLQAELLPLGQGLLSQMCLHRPPPDRCKNSVFPKLPSKGESYRSAHSPAADSLLAEGLRGRHRHIAPRLRPQACTGKRRGRGQLLCTASSEQRGHAAGQMPGRRVCLSSTYGAGGYFSPGCRHRAPLLIHKCTSTMLPSETTGKACTPTRVHSHPHAWIHTHTRGFTPTRVDLLADRYLAFPARQ